MTQPPPRPHRPQLRWATLNLLVATYIMAADNLTLWQRNYTLFKGDPITVATFGAAIWALTALILTVFGFRWLQKPVLVFVLILSAVSSYYMDTLGVIIDRDMVQNAMTTTIAESRQLITPQFLIHVALFGALPAALVIWVRIRAQPLWRNLWTWGLMSVVFAGLFVGLTLSQYRTFAAVVREHRELQGSYQPGAPLAGALRYGKMMLASGKVVVAPLGRDAIKGPRLAAAKKPVLTVIVAGETARAADFGLNGYGRDTTPELAARKVIYFADVRSCGTATATSLPCMFSSFGREDYSYARGIGTENLLDVLSHAGVKVAWFENNTGDKDVAARVEKHRLNDLTDPAFCKNGECNDGIFLGFIKDFVANMQGDSVLVLHQIGSHGPAYYLRYPPAFERFTPDCRTTEFTSCTADQIRNAYDNTILYTDHVLARTIDYLAAQDRAIPALIYVSDHGESLGEGGLYLHGAPYFMAPDVQTQVPMLLWMSPAFQAALGVDAACVAARGAAQTLSHDSLFHTVLGLMNIETSARQDRLDLIAGCRHVSG